MSEMIERVARAICCPDGCDGDTGSGRPCDIRREDRTSMKQARAAIEAMRELPEEPGPRYTAGEYSRRNQEAMVDDVLSDLTK